MAFAHLEASTDGSAQLGADLSREASSVFLFTGSENSLNLPSNGFERNKEQLLLKIERQISGVRCPLQLPTYSFCKGHHLCPCGVPLCDLIPAGPYVTLVSSWEVAATCCPGSRQDPTGDSTSKGQIQTRTQKKMWSLNLSCQHVIEMVLGTLPFDPEFCLYEFITQIITQVHKDFWTRLFTAVWIVVSRRWGEKKQQNKWPIGEDLTKQIMVHLNNGMLCALTRNETHLYVLKQADLQKKLLSEK